MEAGPKYMDRTALAQNTEKGLLSHSALHSRLHIIPQGLELGGDILAPFVRTGLQIDIAPPSDSKKKETFS